MTRASSITLQIANYVRCISVISVNMSSEHLLCPSHVLLARELALFSQSLLVV